MRWSKPTAGASSGSTCLVRTSGQSSSTRPAAGPQTSRFSSSATRSRETQASWGAQARTPAAVPSSIRKSSWAANRRARSRRRASSPKRRSGSPTQRMTPAARSARPPKGSVRPEGSQAIAFMVKSRRARSSPRSPVNSTRSGRRWSVYRPSRRKVVTSTGRPPGQNGDRPVPHAGLHHPQGAQASGSAPAGRRWPRHSRGASGPSACPGRSLPPGRPGVPQRSAAPAPPAPAGPIPPSPFLLSREPRSVSLLF